MSDLVLRSRALDAARARLDCVRADGTPMRNPLLSAMEAERDSVDRLATADPSTRALAAERASRGSLSAAGELAVDSRLLAGARDLARRLLPGVVGDPKWLEHQRTPALVRPDTSPEERARISTGVGMMSSVARSGASRALYDLVADMVRARTGVQLEALPPRAGAPAPWRTWSIRLWSADAASGRFGYVRTAAAVLAAKLSLDLTGYPDGDPAWLEVRDVEDVGGREFGWAARVGAWREARALLGEPAPSGVSVETDPIPERAPGALPGYHTILVEGGQEVRVVCPGGPALRHPGGEDARTVASLVAFDDEVVRLRDYLVGLGCRVVVDPTEEPDPS